MLKHKDEIVARIHHFVEEQLLPAVPLPSMVIDFALAYPRSEGEDFKVVPPLHRCFSLSNICHHSSIALRVLIGCRCMWWN